MSEDPPASERDGRTTVRRRAVLGGATAAVASLAGCTGDGVALVAEKRDTDRRTVDVDGGRLRVDGALGDVRLEPADSDDPLAVRVEKTGPVFVDLSGVSVSVDRDGDTVRVTGEKRDVGPLSQRPTVSVRVAVPEGVAVDAQNGDVSVRDCAGVDDVVSANGDVEVDAAGLRGETVVRSHNDDVEAALAPDLSAEVVARTDNGEVTLNAVPAGTETATESYAELSVGEAEHELHVVSTNGDVTLTKLD